jgi:hypothetical protein
MPVKIITSRNMLDNLILILSYGKARNKISSRIYEGPYILNKSLMHIYILYIPYITELRYEILHHKI